MNSSDGTDMLNQYFKSFAYSSNDWMFSIHPSSRRLTFEDNIFFDTRPCPGFFSVLIVTGCFGVRSRLPLISESTYNEESVVQIVGNTQ